MITKGVVTRAFIEDDSKLSIELSLEDGFLCLLTFNEGNSFYILSKLINNPGKKNPKELIDEEFDLLEHPAGGSLSPIAMKLSPEGRWLYKEEGDWCRWM